jgi:hydrogenase-4 transcriptional activator
VPNSFLHSVVARAQAALERGRGPAAVQLLGPALRSTNLPREDELAARAALAEAWLLQDDLNEAAAALGRPPDTFRDTDIVSAGLLSTLWRLHGRLASLRGDQSRAIALQTRALKCAEAAHDSRAIGLAHYELGHCYRKIGDTAIVREHITRAASALHAAGDRRHLALVHSLSSIMLAQAGKYEEAMSALRHAERLALAVGANDVVATVCGNQANVMMLQHRYDQALALAERSVAVHEAHGSGHGRSVTLATLGQICVRLGDLSRAEEALLRALQMRSPIQFHETTGAVFDTLAQIHLMRGSYERASEYLQQAADAYGSYGRQTSRWYDWSLRVLGARLALRAGQLDDAVARADEIVGAEAPPIDTLQATLIAAEALMVAGRLPEASERLATVAGALDPQTAPATWGEYLRLRGTLEAREGAPIDAYHHFAQSATLLELLGERYEAALSHLALGRLAAESGATPLAEHHLDQAVEVFTQLGAERDLADVASTRTLLVRPGTHEEHADFPVDADEAIVGRIVDAAAMPDLLGRETASAFLEAVAGSGAAVFVHCADPSGASTGEIRIVATAGCDRETALRLARAALENSPATDSSLLLAPLGSDVDGGRFAIVACPRPIGHRVSRRLRMVAAVARQGFALCAARGRSEIVSPSADQSLEPVLPGFLAASAAMARVVEQIQRLQGSDLTVLITGESGTGKELVARAIHVGSHRSAALFLPYNCTTAGRDLADSQLFGHRRGSFTGAVSDQPGLVRTAAGGTLFLDEIGDLALDVQPKLLRFLEQSEVMPLGDARPIRVDVRVLAATNADLEQRVAEGRFREDLYYRLSVIRIHVPPLRERQEEIPHLSTFFLREASERLAKPDVQLSSRALDVFSQYWWPGNVRQLRNEIQRAVAMSAPGSTIEPSQLSPEITAERLPAGAAAGAGPGPSRRFSTPVNLATAVEGMEREIIQEALGRAGGNISETARTLGLTRRGLYLKLRRLGLDAPRAGIETQQ